MGLSHHDTFILLGLLVGIGGPRRAVATDAHPVPDLPGARRARARLRPGPAARRRCARVRARRRACRRCSTLGVLHVAARPAPQHAPDRAARDRAGRRHGRRRWRSSRMPGSGCRGRRRSCWARGGPDRSARCLRDLRAPRHPAQARHADRGREPDQRRDGARRLSRRGRRRRHRHLLGLDLGQGFVVAVAGGLAIGLVVGYLVAWRASAWTTLRPRSRSPC